MATIALLLSEFDFIITLLQHDNAVVHALANDEFACKQNVKIRFSKRN
jgi:hypothetical protein